MTLDDLLDAWSSSVGLTPSEIARIRLVAADSTAELDAEWLWGLLRPVTALLDGPTPLHQTLSLGF